MNVHELTCTFTGSQHKSFRNPQVVDADEDVSRVRQMVERLAEEGYVRKPGEGAPQVWADRTKINRTSLDRWAKALDKGGAISLSPHNRARIRDYLGRSPILPATPEEGVAIDAMLEWLDNLESQITALRARLTRPKAPVHVPQGKANRRR